MSCADTERSSTLAAAVQRALGTANLKDTVHEAMISVVRAERRQRLARHLCTGAGLDFDVETAASARTWRDR